MPNLDKQVEMAKRLVILSYEHQSETSRKWLEAHLDSYNGESNRISLYVLEGSPAKGVVLVNHGMGIIMAFDLVMRKIKTFNMEA